MIRCAIPVPDLLLGLCFLISCLGLRFPQGKQTVFISSDNGILYALDADRGRVKWQYELINVRIEAAPVVSDGLVILGTSSETGVYAFEEQTGRLKWKQPLPQGLIFSARVTDGTVYALASNKAFWDYSGKNFTTLYALDVSTGALKWSFQAGEQTTRAALSNTDENCPLVCKGTVYFGASDGFLYAVDARQGAVKWRFPSGVLFYSSPVWIDGTIYAGNANGSLLAIDDTTGKLKWKIHDAYTIHAGIATDKSLLFIPYDGPASLAAHAVTDGSKKWVFSPGNFVASTPALANGILYTGLEDGSLYALDASNGLLKWKTNLLSDRLTAPTVVSTTVFVGAGRYMYALDAQTGKQKWKFTAQGNLVKSACVQTQDRQVFRGLGAIQP